MNGLSGVLQHFSILSVLRLLLLSLRHVHALQTPHTQSQHPQTSATIMGKVKGIHKWFLPNWCQLVTQLGLVGSVECRNRQKIMHDTVAPTARCSALLRLAEVHA
jgi:hypothetical protein